MRPLSLEHEAIAFGFRQSAIYPLLEPKLKGGVLKTPDFRVLEDVTIPPDLHRAFIPVEFPVDIDPFFLVYRDAMFYLTPSTRSRFAQLGLGVSRNAGKMLAETMEPYSLAYSPQGFVRMTYRGLVMVENYSACPIMIREKQRLFRLFGYHPDDVIQGAALTHIVNPSKPRYPQILIADDERQAKRYGYEYRQPGQRPEDIIGLRLILDNHQTIPAARSGETKVLEIDDTTSSANIHGRTEISGLLRRIIEFQKGGLCISDTAHMVLNGVDLILYRSAFNSMDANEEWGEEQQQIESDLLDDGSDHSFKTEVYLAKHGKPPYALSAKVIRSGFLSQEERVGPDPLIPFINIRTSLAPYPDRNNSIQVELRRELTV